MGKIFFSKEGGWFSKKIYTPVYLLKVLHVCDQHSSKLDEITMLRVLNINNTPGILPSSNLEITNIKRIKEIVSLISSDPPFIDDNGTLISFV